MGIPTYYWKERDKKLLQLVTKWRYITSPQAHYFIFSNIKNGSSKASDRLASLHKKQKVRRTMVGNKYVYYADSEISNKWQHWHELCNFYIRLEQQKKSWEMFNFYPEFSCGNVIVDALLVVFNTGTRQKEKYFIEIDRGTNVFDKAKLFNQLFDSPVLWSREWWADINKEGKARFPKIIVATVRPDVVEWSIKRENKNNLKFRVEEL